MKTKNIIIIISLFLIAVVIAVVLINTSKNRHYLIQENEEIQIPETIFDTEIIVPGTRLTFSYPGKGFYGLGAELMVDEAGRLMSIDTISPYLAESGSQFVVLNIEVTDTSAEYSSLEEIISAKGYLVEQKTEEVGKYKEINGIRFFFVKINEDATSWHAFTVVDNNIIEIIFGYKGSEGTVSEAAFINNDKLFMQLLETFRLQ